MKSVLLSLLLLGACATTATQGVDRVPSERSHVQLDLVPHADASRVLLQAIDPRLPNADRLAHRIRAELGEVASIEVKLCVVPEGRVSWVEVVRGTKLAAFDQSVMADAKRWQFVALPGPANVRTCELATITYRPRA